MTADLYVACPFSAVIVQRFLCRISTEDEIERSHTTNDIFSPLPHNILVSNANMAMGTLNSNTSMHFEDKIS